MFIVWFMLSNIYAIQLVVCILDFACCLSCLALTLGMRNVHMHMHTMHQKYDYTVDGIYTVRTHIIAAMGE